MSRSLHTQKLELRAARRLARPYVGRRADAALLTGQAMPSLSDSAPERRLPIRAQKPLPGTLHPLNPRDIRGLIEALGPASLYGIPCIRLRRECGVTPQGIVFGEYLLSGEIHLYAVPSLTWKLPYLLQDSNLAAFVRHGCHCEVEEEIERTTLIWSLSGLRTYYLYEVLAHELGHHLLQYHKGKRSATLCRRADHEKWADLHSSRVQARLRNEPPSL